MKNSPQKIGFIGCGNMASAIIAGLISDGFNPSNIIASNPSEQKLENIQTQFKINTTLDNQEIAQFADIIVLAIKPQVLPIVCQQLRRQDLSNKLIISIAAGISIEKIGTLLSADLAIIRAMPNTPATISMAATGLFANDKVSNQQKADSTSIFTAVGTTQWLADESQMDTVTAIAGSSPAYFFYFLQSMIEQAVDSGLDYESAKNITLQAMLGSVSLAISQPTETLKALQEKVTSAGGTTAAAIASFEENNFSNIIKQAVSAAIDRGRELGEKT